MIGTQTAFQTTSDVTTEERLWQDAQLAQFDELLRVNYDKELGDFSHTLLKELAETVSAARGAFFVLDDDERYLEVTATYAISKDKLEKPYFEVGEGLNGQAVASKTPIYLDDVPMERSSVESGLSNYHGRFLLSLPLVFNEMVYGAIELVLFQPLEQKEINFLQPVSRNIASTLQNIRSNERNRRLLKELQNQTEQMRAQEEEMRQNMEELQATQEQIEKSREELMQYRMYIDSFINNTKDTIFAIDTGYRIIIANETLKERFRSEGIELQEGKHIADAIGQEAFEKVWKARYDRAFAGEQYTFMTERPLSDRTLYVEAFVNPIYNDRGEVIGCTVASHDITEYKNAAITIQELREEKEALEKQLEEARQASS
jgi:PAS domain-containing protein